MNRNFDWSRIAVMPGDTKVEGSRNGTRTVRKFASEEERFEETLKLIGYDASASVDIADPATRRRFFEYWARRMKERREAGLR